MKLRVLFRRDADCFCEGTQIIAVVVEAAGLAGFRDGAALIEQRFGQGDALCGDVFVDGGAGGLLENTAQIGRAHKKMRGQTGERQRLCLKRPSIPERLPDPRGLPPCRHRHAARG